MAINGFNAIFQSATGVNQFTAAGGYSSANAGSTKQIEGAQPALRGSESYTMGNFKAHDLNHPALAQGQGLHFDLGYKPA